MMMDIEFLKLVDRCKKFHSPLDKCVVNAHDEIISLQDRLTAAESDLKSKNKQLHDVIMELITIDKLIGVGVNDDTVSAVMALASERDQLRAQVDAANSQEPVGEIDRLEYSVEASEELAIAYIDANRVKIGDKLYLSPLPPKPKQGEVVQTTPAEGVCA